MKHRGGAMSIGAMLLALAAPSVRCAPLSDAAARELARQVFRQLIEIDTTDSTGSTFPAAQAMARRLLEAGFAGADVTVIGPSDRKANLVARYRGRPGSTLKPVLIIGHTDVVEARREDWSTDPFQLVEKDGYYYGRGTQDMKDSDAIAVTTFIRMKRQGFVPDRDIILALTADEEGGGSNGVSWLLERHRELIDAEFALNPDVGGVVSERGKIVTVEFEATEKLYADYQLLATDAGGHSSLPRPDNAIYHIADALAVLQRSPFPVELNEVTREYFAQMAQVEPPAAAADMRALLQTPVDEAAAARLSEDPRYNATLRTTCVPTTLAGGHAFNALPLRAEANVNCRIVPGHSQEEIRLDLVRLFDDPALSIRYRADDGILADHGSSRKAMAPPPLNPDVMRALRAVSQRLWPGTPVVPIMETKASDSIYTILSGIPSYGICGVAIDRDDVRMHGKDERLKVESFDRGLEFYFEFLESLTSSAAQRAPRPRAPRAPPR